MVGVKMYIIIFVCVFAVEFKSKNVLGFSN